MAETTVTQASSPHILTRLETYCIRQINLATDSVFVTKLRQAFKAGMFGSAILEACDVLKDETEALLRELPAEEAQRLIEEQSHLATHLGGEIVLGAHTRKVETTAQRALTLDESDAIQQIAGYVAGTVGDIWLALHQRKVTTRTVTSENKKPSAPQEMHIHY